MYIIFPPDEITTIIYSQQLSSLDSLANPSINPFTHSPFCGVLVSYTFHNELVPLKNKLNCSQETVCKYMQVLLQGTDFFSGEHQSC